MRLADRANKKVGYNDPLTQTITTNKYIKSHIDLLSEDSPFSAEESEKEKLETLDVAMAYTGDETKDGGQTPGPFEEMRRRMAESDLETPGARKRKRKEKKRKWEVWKAVSLNVHLPSSTFSFLTGSFTLGIFKIAEISPITSEHFLWEITDVPIF